MPAWLKLHAPLVDRDDAVPLLAARERALIAAGAFRLGVSGEVGIEIHQAEAQLLQQ
jgi:hypothetical protein